MNLNKQIYTGTSILDLSKVLMKNFHYNYTQNKYGDKSEMLLTDSDGVPYKIYTEKFYKGLYKDRELLDFSNSPKDLKYNNGLNNLVKSKMRCELCDTPM